MPAVPTIELTTRAAWVVKGVTEFDAADGREVPAPFVAVIVKVYAVPGVKPRTVMVPEPAVARVPVRAPGEEVAVYKVMAEPPLETGAV